MIRFLLTLTTLTVLSLPVGASPPIEQLFPDELSAVRAAVNSYNPISVREDREFMGLILHRDGAFDFTVVAGKRGADSISFTVDREQWQQAVALWHTHGGTSPRYRYFSDVDTRTAVHTGLPFYLADYTGFLKVFRPGDRMLSAFAARRLGLGQIAGYAVGSPVREPNGRAIRVATR